MINRQILHEALLSDFISKYGYNPSPSLDEARADEGFPFQYQLDRLNVKENNGVVSLAHKEASFQNFLQIQQDLRDFNKEIKATVALFPEGFNRMKHILSELLPPVSFIEDEMWDLCTFGPGTFHGAIKELKATGYSIHYKIGGAQTVTALARNLALDVIAKYFPHWREHLQMSQVQLECVSGNRLAYVVKDVRKCRPIAIEPSLNVFLQQGVGRYLGRLLRKRAFADIYDGQLVQRRRAKYLKNATIDLSNASDTISVELLREVLPADWFHLLMTIRSPFWSKGQESGRYENISSQGNAFTFPLETMIFKAAILAFTDCSPRDVTVYGDDIIVPIQYAEASVEALEILGFTVNKEKSYYSQFPNGDQRNKFRESCGADFFNEVYVTPVYYRDNATSYADIATLYNRLYERWGFLPSTHNYLLSLIPQSERLWGPQDFISDGWNGALIPFKGKNVHKNGEGPFGNASIIYIPFVNSPNFIVRTYSSYLWINECHDFPSSGKGWSFRAREISKKHKLNEYTSYLSFLLGSEEVVPRLARPIKCKLDMVEALSCHAVPIRGSVSEVRSF